MSKKICILNGSPRLNGNTEALIARFTKGAQAAGNEVEVFYLNQIEAKGCQACMGCKKTGKCVRKDGMTPVLESVANCDSVILATPDYFGQATSQYRMFEDRMYGFVRGDFTCAIEPKKLAIVVTSGSGAGAADIEAMMNKVMTNYFKFETMGSIVFSEAQSGPAKDSAEVMAAAEELAKKL